MSVSALVLVPVAAAALRLAAGSATSQARTWTVTPMTLPGAS
jgi:hypothetical protein